MSPVWDMASSRASGVCARCGHWTDNGITHWIPRMSAADVRIVVCADAAECILPPEASEVAPRIGHSA
ncbi:MULTISPECIES: hypothetical protein [unclassified Streptomyces]|uniref:hypothetical protein n=1 Tax=unclassified Streptomyces TaxID=2593676 RepID=UPI00070C8F66|nr:hypothetical protein [Streptomyces sp. Root1310]KQX63421.1 hypothetical protein ASD48_26035 [Streptomyces sp. Root1310]